MLKYKKGNLLDVTKGIIVHGCNCQGVMGSGVAKQIKKKWPEVFDAYEELYYENDLRLGSIQAVASWDDFESGLIDPSLTATFANLPSGLIVVNAMTQKDYGITKRQYISYTAITACMLQVKLLVEATGFEVHMPKIGAGLGGGDWVLIEKILRETIVNATVWELS